MTKINPALRAQLRALEAVVKADKAERRATEAPVRAARAKLAKRLGFTKVAVDKHNLKVSRLIYSKASSGGGLFVPEEKLVQDFV